MKTESQWQCKLPTYNLSIWFSVFIRNSLEENSIVYNTARDYEDVKTENFPLPYPTGQNYTWSWSVNDGQWAIYFTDAEIACADNEPGEQGDQLIISRNNQLVQSNTFVRSPLFHKTEYDCY